MDYKDYYSILGVPRDVSKADLQKAYRKLARKFHPDVNRGAEAEAKFKEINEAHEVLKDPEKRAKYDRFGSAWKQSQSTGGAPPGFEDIFSGFSGSGGASRGGFGGGGEGFSSFFEMLFGGGGGPQAGGFRGQAGPFGGGGAAPMNQKGANLEAMLSLNLEEAAHGGPREIGLADPSTGQKRTLRVTIPPGVNSGKKIRLSGQGGPGMGSGAQGDLLLTVEIRPDPRFRLEGNDLHTVLSVSPWEAALGSTADLPTLEGPVTVKIPAGSSSGRKIRLRGKGFPRSGGEAGDLYAEIKIVLPTEMSERETELYQQLASDSDFKPRG